MFFLLLVIYFSSTIIHSMNLSQQVLMNIAPEQDNNTLSSFLHFVQKYKKTYISQNEILYRLNVYQHGLMVAKTLNEESMKIGGASFGETKFSDFTQEEFRNIYLMKYFDVPKELLEDKNHHNVTISGPVKGGAFDWNSKGMVTNVYDQGACGSCWAFSATENLESVYAILLKKPLQSLSPQQIVSCDSPTYGCNGGNPTQAWTYIYDQGGLDLWSCYPYVGLAEACSFKTTCVGADVLHWNWVYPGNENSMASWLTEGAPISICLDASIWQYYTGGVVLGTQCPGTPKSNHCVLITGYNLNTNPNYWIVRNSWGTNWGENGYIYLQWGTDTCGLSYYPASTTNVIA